MIALKPDFHYLPPTTSSANECNCNTVVYSMFAACTACQADGLMLPYVSLTLSDGIKFLNTCSFSQMVGVAR